MSTNPNNSVGTNGAFGGRTSVNAFNDIMGAFQSRGVLSGWGISPSSGMTVSVGGNGTTRDVAVAEDASGNKTSVNNISGAPILVTLDSAPASNSRYDAIVVYVDKPPMGNATQDNPECCGIIPVTGTAASSPSYPSDATIRSAITADGASGATAYYAILGYVLVASGTTTITSGMVTNGAGAAIGSNQIDNGAVTSQKVDWSSITYGAERIIGYLSSSNKPIYEREFSGSLSVPSGSYSNATTLINGVDKLLFSYGYMERNSTQFPLSYINTPVFSSSPVGLNEFARIYRASNNSVALQANSTTARDYTYDVFLWYTKN